MYEITLECAMVPPWLLPFGRHPLLSSPFSLLFHSSRPGCATHRHHLAIHLGPVLLITRLELRARSGGPREFGRCASERRGRARRSVTPRVARSRERRPLLLPAGETRVLFRSPVSVSRPLPPTANDGFFIPLATKSPLYAAGGRIYFVRRMLFSTPRDYSRSASSSRSFVPSLFVMYACLAAGSGREKKREKSY